MSLDATIDLEISDALLGLEDFQRNQLPFATAVALTRTAQAGQSAIRSGLSDRFTIRNTFVERGTKVKRATKRNQEAVVHWRAPGGAARRGFAENLSRQEEGGLKRPRGRLIAIPREAGKKRTAGGMIPKRLQPAEALKRKGTFIAKAGAGLAIYRRRGRGRLPLQTLYYLTPGPARVGERFEFVDTALRTARREYRREFGRALGKAIATARR